MLNCAEHGDHTSRRRWFLTCFLHNGAIEWPKPSTEFEGLTSVLDDPKTVSLARIVPATEQFVARNARSQPNNTTANKLGSYRVYGVTDDRSVRVYDTAHPLPSATTTKSVLLGSPGGLVRSWIGDYQVSALEVARAHGFTKEALAQVERLTSTDEQWRWVANSTPRRTVQALLSAILDALQSPRQLGLQDVGPITTQSDVAQCAAAKAADSGLPMTTATAPELVSAVQRLVDAMPTKDELAALQAADPETKALLEWIRKGRAKKDIPDLPSKWRKEAKYLHLLDGVLFFRPVLDPHDELVDVPVLPAGLRRGALMAMHYDPLMCHPASKALFALARKRYYWPGMSSDCTKIVHGCGHCDRAKATQRMGAGATKPMLYSQPFQRMSIDLVGPLTQTKAGFKWILSCIDAFTNYVTFVPLPNKEAATVVEAFFRKCICVHGAPQILLSDRGSEFTAGTFEALMDEYNIDHRVTSPYCPSTNGQCERAHRRLNAILKICVNLWNKEWDQCLEQAAFSYNVTPLTDFPYSPYFMLHLFHPRLPADLKCSKSTEPTTAAKFPCIGDYIGEKKELQKAVHQTVMVAKLEEATKRKLKADDLQRIVQYNPDDLVTVWRPVTSYGKTKSSRSTKLLYKNIGPFKVIEPIVRSSAGTSNDEPPLTYRLMHVSTGKVDTYSVRHMFPFMRGTKHSQVGEELQEEWAPNIHDGELGLVLRHLTDVHDGMYLWMKPRGGQPGFLSKVTAVDERSDLIEVQLLNTTSDKRVGQWQLVWFDDHPDPKKRLPKPVSKGDEWHEYRTPVSNKPSNQLKPWLETASFSDFIPIALELQPDAQGYLRLPTKFYEKHIKPQKLIPTTKLLKEEQRDLSWYVDTSASVSTPVVSPATGSVNESVVLAPLTNVPRRATRSTRNPAPVHATKLHYPLEYDEDTDYVGGDGTRIAVAKWIQAHADPRSAPKRLAGAELIKFTDSASFSAGNCKGLSATRSGTSPFPPSSKSGRAGRRSWLAHRLQALTQK